MAKIKDIVQLKSGYANFVELKSAFEAAQENTDRMAMYRPTKAHRKALERICRGLYQPNDKKFYLKSGSYGTGKSHLSLMEANILSLSSGDPAIAGFYDNYAKLDPEKAQQLKNVRKDGQYLVAICDYYSGKQFEDVVLKAVFEACRNKGLDADVESEFEEAERQLDEWEKKGDAGGIRNFYQDFGKALETSAPGISVEQLRVGLREFDSGMLAKFRVTFREMMGGLEFQSKSGNLIPILKKLIKSPAFKERFKGLAIFYDEFGFTLEKAAYSKDVLQGFMETICHQEPNVIFVGCIHKDFTAYADRLSKADAAVMSARITQVDLLNEGIEEIIGAIVETDKHSDVWQKEVQPKTAIFDQLVPPCKTLGLFPWIDDLNRIRQRVLEDIYGVHPMALSCLLHLSSEIGSDARSTFTFFSGDVGGKEGSYAQFIENEDITQVDGKLRLYTVDRLYTFFRKELSPKNTELRDRQRQAVNGYQATIEAMRKTYQRELLDEMEKERLKCLRTILIYQLCQIPTNLENMQFGLYCLSNSDKNQIKSLLNDMVKKNVLFFRKQSQTYELANSAGEDPNDLIDRYMASPQLHPTDALAAFLEEAGGKKLEQYAPAKGYNLPFAEDKRFHIRIIRAKDIGEALWDDIRQGHAETRLKPEKSSEGTLVYAICEDDAQVELAREAAKNISDENVALAVPHEPHPFTELLLKVKACRHFLPPSEAEKISAQTESLLRDMLESQDGGFLSDLTRIFTHIMDGSGACWYRIPGRVLVDRPKQPHQPADMLCEALFTKRCRIMHPDLNFCHDEKWRTGKNTALKQAVGVLLTAEQVLIDNGNPDNHGEKRYLEKVLLKGAGALRKIGNDGSVNYFACESDPTVIHDDFPVLKELCRRLSQLNPGESFPLGRFLEDARNPPYGVGGTPLMLAVAHVLRAYGERLTVYQDSTCATELRLRKYDELAGIVGDPAPKTVFVVRNITQAQERLLSGVATVVNAPDLKHGETRTLQATLEALRQWWKTVPSVAGIVTLYAPERQARLQALKDILDQLAPGTDRFDFMLNKFPEVYSLGLSGSADTPEHADAVCAAFAEDVQTFNSGEQLALDLLAQEICPVFDAKGDMIECAKAIEAWYHNLSSSQRDPFKCENPAARQLLTRLKEENGSTAGKIGTVIPTDFGFGTLANWTSLHVKDLAAKIKQAKEDVDKARPDVPKPIVPGTTLEIDDGGAAFVDIPEGAVSLKYSLDKHDPRNSDTAGSSSTRIDLAPLLKGRSNVTVRIRAVDQDGNFSDMVDVRLVSKERKYDLQFPDQRDFLKEKKASFLWPEDRSGLVAVMRSLITYAKNNNLLESDEAGKVLELLQEMSAKQSGAGENS
jgi:hypothetical protein